MKNTHKSKVIVKNLEPIKTTIAYDTYWKFAFERQNIFSKRFIGQKDNLTNDPILSEYKFTNTYRVCDRVSQFLVKNVIYSKESLNENDIFLRVILYKLFNRIETWKLLENKFGTICAENFDVKHFSKFLNEKMNNGVVLYSNAYMMASGCKEFKVTRKHQAHMLLLQKMLKENLPQRLCDTRTMADGYTLLLSYPMIGKFLAYQYITDLNYSEIVDFSESEFTVPGPGARDGIRKCFSDLGGLSESDIIKLMADRQEIEFERLGLEFKTLGGRRLQYIDIQNIFCETDKYCRVAHPEISGISGRMKIKQKFSIDRNPIHFTFPAKWNLSLGD